MQYNNKHRDMSRSVLPSTKRRSARASKRDVQHSVRARVNDALRTYCDEDDFDDFDFFADPQYNGNGGYYQRNIKDVVFERRQGDKLGPLINWAVAKADEFGATPAERYAKLRSLLPDGIIGDHAMTHVDHLPEYDIEGRSSGRRIGTTVWYGQTPAELAAEQKAHREQMVAEVAEVVKLPGIHKAFNARVKLITPTGHTRRKLVRCLDGDEVDKLGPKVFGWWAHAVYEDEYYTCARCTEHRVMLKGWANVEEWLAAVKKTCKSQEYYNAFRKFHEEYCQ